MEPVLSTLGYLLKKEKLATLATDFSYSELLLESLEPYPGFYDEYFVPTTSHDQTIRSVFMVIRNSEMYYVDEFIRLTYQIKSKHNILFDAAISNIMLFNEPAKAIRINMPDYSYLPEIISYFKDVGVKFQATKEVNPYHSLIKIRRFFNLETMAPGFYKDADKEFIYYFELPIFMTWDEFEKATYAIRNNFDYKTFDAAQAAIFNKGGLTELVRIYDLNADLSKLRSLQQKYSIELERK